MIEGITTKQFASFFNAGVDVLGLKDSEIADMFSASRPTAERWKRGESAPAPFLRMLIVGRIAAEIVTRFNLEVPEDTDSFCAEPIDTEILQAILKW